MDTNRDDMLIYLLDNILLGIRNRIHLLTADSSGVEKIQK